MEHSEGLADFLTLCQTASSRTELEGLFSLFLTLEEQRALALRVLLVKALLNGECSQRDIAKTLNISISKITRGSNNLKTLDPQLKTFLLQYWKVASNTGEVSC